MLFPYTDKRSDQWFDEANILRFASTAASLVFRTTLSVPTGLYKNTLCSSWLGALCVVERTQGVVAHSRLVAGASQL